MASIAIEFRIGQFMPFIFKVNYFYFSMTISLRDSWTMGLREPLRLSDESVVIKLNKGLFAA